MIREGDELVLRLSTLEKLGGMRGDIRVPLDAMQDVVVSEDPFGALRGMRAPGTGIPRVIALGTWRYKGLRDFAALYRGKAAVIVHLHDAPFERLFVSADDANALAAAIRAG